VIGETELVSEGYGFPKEGYILFYLFAISFFELIDIITMCVHDSFFGMRYFCKYWQKNLDFSTV